MTKSEFVDGTGAREKTVNKWLENGYIPGAINNNGEWTIPDSARAPYTEARAKNRCKIFASILMGSNKGKHVLPKIYKISENEFLTYVSQLVNAGLLVIRNEDGVDYYDVTLNTSDYLSTSPSKKAFNKFINNALAAVSEGVATAILNAEI